MQAARATTSVQGASCACTITGLQVNVLLKVGRSVSAMAAWLIAQLLFAKCPGCAQHADLSYAHTHTPHLRYHTAYARNRPCEGVNAPLTQPIKQQVKRPIRKSTKHQCVAVCRCIDNPYICQCLPLRKWFGLHVVLGDYLIVCCGSW